MSELTTVTNAAIDDVVDDEIAGYLDPEKPRSFFLFAGAGSGKTRSLVKALTHIRNVHGRSLAFRGQRVAIVTYTNAACDEIKRRIDFHPLFHVSTIHSFAWELIKYFNTDIKVWLRKSLEQDLQRLEQEEAKGRVGTKASIVRQTQIGSKSRRLARLDAITAFTYNPTGENKEPNSLNHTEVIELCADFLSTKPLMQQILVGRFPFLLIDESQDTNKILVDALFSAAKDHEGCFALGLIGDVMQRIYADGKDKIEQGLAPSWGRPSKQLNHRCPKRVVGLINKIRSSVDTHVQVPRTDAPEGMVRLFIRRGDAADRKGVEDAVRKEMAKKTGDASWCAPEGCKTLTLEHHMAAKRLGFSGVFEPLYAIDAWRTGLLDGSLPVTRFFTGTLLPLIEAQRKEDRFAVARIVRGRSPLLSAQALKEAADPGYLLHKAQTAVNELRDLWQGAAPNCGQVLKCVSDSGLFVIPETLKPAIEVLKSSDGAAPAYDESVDPLTEESAALLAFLQAPFEQIHLYDRYVTGLAPFDTHQGVKGLEFERVMVILDDAEARGFMFGYEKLLGAKAASSADLKNAREGKETGVDRTRRLLYVTCSRAEKSLALVAYTESPAAVREFVVKNGWFEEDEVDYCQ